MGRGRGRGRGLRGNNLQGGVARQPGTYPAFYNYKWSTLFKKCESPYGTPVTYIILHSNCTSVNRKKKITMASMLRAGEEGIRDPSLSRWEGNKKGQIV